MIKKTLYFGNPAYLSLANRQLVVKMPEVERNDGLPDIFKQKGERTIPVEDIGVVVLDHQQITITHGLMAALLDNNVAVVTCSQQHMPSGLLLPLEGNSIHQEKFRTQLEASQPLKKQLWQQTVKMKIENQAFNLSLLTSQSVGCLYAWSKEVRSGDPDNLEARAAAYYWKNLFADYPSFVRDRDGAFPNGLLNYGYAVLRAVIARALVSTGLLPVLGIHHHNRYNAYCLADDVMEPYRPFVDHLVVNLIKEMDAEPEELTKEHKAKLLSIPVVDVRLNGKKSPLMVAASQTASSLAQCFAGQLRKISYPTFL
jgi:CRISPR-associated protein Cas1